MAPTTAREMAIFRCFTGDTEKQGNAPTANYFMTMPCVSTPELQRIAQN
jgi:hypothetical protein